MYRLNLLPTDLLPGPHVDRRRLALIAAVTLAVGLLAIVAAVGVSRFVVARQELAWTRAELAALQEAAARARQVSAERRKLEQAAAAFDSLKAQARPYKPLLDQIGTKVPVDLWLTSVEIFYDEKQADKNGEPPGSAPPSRAQPGYNPLKEQTGGASGTPAPPSDGKTQENGQEADLPPPPDTVLIKGESRSVPSVGVFVRHLSENPSFAAVSLDEIQERKEDRTFSFVITCRLAEAKGGAPGVGTAQ